MQRRAGNRYNEGMPDDSNRIVFMGTPDFAAASLRRLLDAGYPVAAVVTQPDRPRGRGQEVAKPPVKELAEAHGIPVVQPEKIRTPEFEAWLRAQQARWAVVVAYGRILPANVLAVPPGGCINVHASLLPRWRGASPIQWAIVNGDRETGVTTMLMDEGLDTGPMLVRRALAIGPDEDAASLHDRLAALGGDVLLETLRGLADGSVRPEPQPAEGATYAPILKKEDGAIDWSAPAERIHDRVRGLTPWPGAFSHAGGQYVKILRTAVLSGTAAPGAVAAVQADGVDVGTGEGLLRLIEVQPAGKRRMGAGEFARGLRLSPGAPLFTAPADPERK